MANFINELRGTGAAGHTSRHKDIIKVIMYKYHFLHSLKGRLPLPIFGWANGKTKHCAPLKNADELYGRPLTVIFTIILLKNISSDDNYN